jgi:hypothetical protein
VNEFIDGRAEQVWDCARDSTVGPGPPSKFEQGLPLAFVEAVPHNARWNSGAHRNPRQDQAVCTEPDIIANVDVTLAMGMSFDASSLRPQHIEWERRYPVCAMLAAGENSRAFSD